MIGQWSAESRVLDKYQLLCKLADGSKNTQIIKTLCKATGKLVALKLIQKDGLSNDQIDSVRNEVRILQTLKHTNIVSLLSYDFFPLEYVLVFPFYPCGDLFQLLAKRGPLPETIAQGILSQLVRALHYLHCDRGIVHRDVKLENILVESMNGANVSVVLADFGLAKVIHDRSTMTPCGTYEYAAPEVIQEIEYSKKVDMWALGCALFTLLVAYPPFYDDESGLLGDKIRMGRFEFLSPWWDGISLDAKHLISCLLEVNPRVRYGTVEVAKHAWLSSGQLSPSGQGPAAGVNQGARGASWATRSATSGVLSPGVRRAFHRSDNSWSPLAETLKTPSAQTPYLSDNENVYPDYFQGTEEELSGDTAQVGECRIDQGGPIELSSPVPWTPFQDSPRISSRVQIDQQSWREAVNAPLKHFTEATSLGLDRDLSMLMLAQESGGNQHPFELNLSSSTLHKKRHLK